MQGTDSRRKIGVMRRSAGGRRHLQLLDYRWRSMEPTLEPTVGGMAPALRRCRMRASGFPNARPNVVAEAKLNVCPVSTRADEPIIGVGSHPCRLCLYDLRTCDRSSNHFNQSFRPQLRDADSCPCRQVFWLKECSPGGVHFVFAFHIGQINHYEKQT